MSFFFNEERAVYRKWVNVVTSLLLPGLAQVLSGRVVAGVNWFLGSLAGGAVVLILVIFAKLPIESTSIWLIRIGFHVVAAADGCKKGIPRLNFVKWLGVVVAVVFVPILTVVTGPLILLRPLKIPTAGMEPTLMGNQTARDGSVIKEGDHILAERFAYLFHKPRRGEIAIFKTQAINAQQRDSFRVPPDQLYVKRIVGLPGERVSVQANAIYINGEKLVEPKIFETIMARTNPLPEHLYGVVKQPDEITLGANEYYVLGDNLWNSLDSRYYGAIQGGYFGGKVFLIYMPGERRGFVQ